MTGQLHCNVVKRFPRGPVIAADFRQPIHPYSVTALFGPSGCGKTTILRCLAGLETPSEGRIDHDGQVWFDSDRQVRLTPQARDVGLLFQDYCLFPHLTIAENIAFGVGKLDRRARRTVVERMLTRFQLADLADRYPRQTSGGQQQRIALARVLARRPRLLLLDEPLSALDSSLREELRRTLRDLLAEFAIPAILVTHDRSEVMALADRLVVLEAGQVLQQGTVQEVFSRPAHPGVARIVGIETIEPGEIVAVAEGLATVRVARTTLLALAPPEGERLVHACMKGEDVVLQRERVADVSVRNQLDAVVQWLVPEGALMRVGLDAGFPLTALVTRPACQQLGLEAGARIVASIKAPSIHLIPRRS